MKNKEQKMKKKFTFIDLFDSCGGLSLGFEQAGFTSVFANEIVPFAAETYKRSHGASGVFVFRGDAETQSG